MIIDKISNKENIQILTKRFNELVEMGISADKILVLVSNATSKKNLIDNILNTCKADVLSDLKIYTYNGMIYNTVLDNWIYLTKTNEYIKDKIFPNLTGLEITQFILKDIIKDIEVKGYNSKKSLLHQIFRRYSLIVNNNLTEDEVKKRSTILKESFSEDAKKIIKRYKNDTFMYNCFDYIRQADLFSNIYKNTDYFKNIEYLLAEDADERSELFLDFFETISSQLKDNLIILDSEGKSRIGYLCAVIDGTERLKSIFDNTGNNLSDKNTEELPKRKIEIYSHSKRLNMLDDAISKINSLINSGVKPNEISVISPLQDKMLKFNLKENLKNCVPLFISGNEKLVETPIIKYILTILKISLEMEINEYELRGILTKILNISLKDCKEIINNYSKDKYFKKLDNNNNYNKFCYVIEKLKSSSAPISEKAYFIYKELIFRIDSKGLTKFNFLLKELQGFERTINTVNSTEINKEIITLLENSIISENPYSIINPGENEIIISTPQKIIDNKIETKYQIWLDITSDEWIKSDIGPLYNSWVFQKRWEKDSYEIEDDVELSRLKTFKIIRKLMLNTEIIIGYSSLFDTQCNENTHGIDDYLISDIENTPKRIRSLEIIPRKDQEAVLEYKKGQMAISAVPGAGKTTILLALILKFLERGIAPNSIQVVTYMESAARNFKDRIKSLDSNNTQIPNISTIHGLALRILKENSNYERLGLNPDFDICDDIKKGTILKSISNNITKQEFEDFERGISVLKLGNTDIYEQNKEEFQISEEIIEKTKTNKKLNKFIQFFIQYQNALRLNNLIDYDDILSLATILLKQNNDILKYYQEQCRYIIEDEAQDSSSIQQELLTMLSGKHRNIIRCGDINQAITGTFTNADIKGFKDFINSSDSVKMNCSQRCSKKIWELANKLVKFGNSNGNEPFYEIYMEEVENKNPKDKIGINSQIYNNETDEKNNILRKIKELLSKDEECTIGILLRNNYQVNNWAQYITRAGLKTITRNECLGEKSIFRVIFSVLKLISTPWDNEICANTYEILSANGLYKTGRKNKILNCKNDFITISNDDIEDYELRKFHWDMNYWLEHSLLSIDELVLKIGLTYFSEEIAKSNIYLISTLCAKLNTEDFNSTLKKLEDLSKRPNLSGFKFFSQVEDSEKIKGRIQLMTMHKSKGDEFDYVFIPELSEKNLTIDKSQLKVKDNSNFMEDIKSLNPRYKNKTVEEIKTEIISENYRLLYVAITRAKKRLYISVSKAIKYYNKQTENTPNTIFRTILADNIPG